MSHPLTTSSASSSGRASIEDLEQAIDWCRHGYEPHPDEAGDPEAPAARLARAAAWMEAEVLRRREDAAVRRIIADVKAETGKTPTNAQARAALRRSQARNAAVDSGPAVAYVDRYGDRQQAHITDPEYDVADLWEGVDYAARDARSGLLVTLTWDETAGWSEVQR